MKIIAQVAIGFMFGVVSAAIATIIFGFWGFVGWSVVWAAYTVSKLIKHFKGV